MSLLASPLGYRCDGRPFWAPSFGEGEGGEGGDGGGGDDGGTGSGGADANAVDSNGLTEAGRQAIARERSTLKTVRTELRGFKAVLADHGITTADGLAEFLTKSKGSQEGSGQPQVNADEIRRKAEQEADTKANRRVARAEIKALAVETFADTDDAVSQFSDEDVDDLLGRDGGLDAQRAKQALADVLTKKPHWAKQQEERPPSFDGGARGTPGAPETFSGFIRGQVAAKRGIR